MRLLVSIMAMLMIQSCGGTPKPPSRGVIEADVERWGFRRYQSVLDVEVWVSDNKAVAHTASYARKSSEKKGRIEDKDVVNAFVTRYEKEEGVQRALVVFVRRLTQQSGYTATERKAFGARLVEVKGPSELWVFWPAKRHVIKLGGRALESVPDDLIEAYADRYPSQLAAGALEGPLPEGPAEREIKQEKFDPKNPKPEWN